MGTCGMKNAVFICRFGIESRQNRMVWMRTLVSRKETSWALCSTVTLIVGEMLLRCNILIELKVTRLHYCIVAAITATWTTF